MQQKLMIISALALIGSAITLMLVYDSNMRFLTLIPIIISVFTIILNLRLPINP